MSKAPTVLMAAPYFPPEGGGLEMYVQQIGKRLYAEHGWRVCIITSQRGKHDTVREEDGMKIYGLAYRWRLSNTPFDTRWRRTVKRIIAIEQPDLINVHTPVPGLPNVVAAAVGKRPVVVTYHSSSLKKGNPLVDVPIWAYEHTLLPWMLGRAQRIICSSDFVRNGFLHRYLYKSLTLTAAVDPQVFRPAQATNRPQQPRIICLGGLHAAEPHKGLATILQACQLLQQTMPELRLTVIGDGDNRTQYEAEAKRLGLQHVTFTGRLAPADNAVAFRQGTVFALPTAKDSLPTVLMEAMATGLPVVTTDVGSITDLVTDGEHGVIIPHSNPAALAQAIQDLHRDPARMAQMGEAGRRKIVAHYSWQQIAAQTHEVFHDIVKPLSSRGESRT